MGRFKKGLFLGGLLGAGLMWLNGTTRGREYRAKMIEHLTPLYAQLKESVKKLEGPTKEMYCALVERAVEEYAARKEMAEDMKVSLIKELKKKWDGLIEDIRKK